MRSRYTAYVRRDEAYLLRTWAESQRPVSLELEGTAWLGLQVLAADSGGTGDATGTVTFAAHYQLADGSLGELRESSHFSRERDDWVYLDDVEER